MASATHSSIIRNENIAPIFSSSKKSFSYITEQFSSKKISKKNAAYNRSSFEVV
jgi:hypothetical protein